MAQQVLSGNYSDGSFESEIFPVKEGTQPPFFSRSGWAGFTLGEVCVSIAITAFFCAAVFASNSRLLSSLKNQKETTAVSMMLQERMEQFRTTSYSNVADKDYVKNNILTFNPAGSSLSLAHPPSGRKIHNLLRASAWVAERDGDRKRLRRRRIAKSGSEPDPAQDYNQWIRDMSGDGKPHEQTITITCPHNMTF